MNERTRTVVTDDIELFIYLCDEPATSAVQIHHSLAEHAARYHRFARALTDAGYCVYAPG